MYYDSQILCVFILLLVGTTSLTEGFGKGVTNKCRVDVCAMNKEGLRCPTGSTIHILNVLCSSPGRECPWGTYDALYPCYGSRNCTTTSLKGLLSQVCDDPDVAKRSVMMEYLCLPARTESKCSGTNFRQLDVDYGILRTPEFDFHEGNVQHVCKWNITSRGDQRIKITISAQNWLTGCDNVFNISYVDCNSRRIKTSPYCNFQRSREELISCGPVKIVSRRQQRQPNGDGALEKFIISYQRDGPNSPLGLPCEMSSFDNVTNVPLPSRITQRPSVKLSPAIPNYGPGDEKQEKSSSLSKKLKLIIIYVFFGVIILVLAVALIAVIISYHRLSKNGSSSGSSSEKTALWHQKDETPLDTFQTNSMAEGSESLTSETIYPYTVASESDKIVATVHHDAISENEEFNHRLSSGSGISTFLSGKRDNDFRDLINTFQTGSFAVYDDVNTTNGVDADFYQMPAHEIYEMSEKEDSSNIYEVIDRDHQNNSSNKSRKVFPNSYSSVPNNHDLEGNDSGPFVDHATDDCHYSVNNDEYAIVQKSRKQVQEASLSGDYEPLFDNGEVVDFRPTSGPYEKMRNSNREPSTRWSKGGERWTDDY